MPDIKHGIEVIKNNVKIAPVNPGVYRMLDKNGKVLYVGKAKSIKKELSPIRILTSCPIT